MNKKLITALALLGACSSAMAESNMGLRPEQGASYRLYNVGTKQFLNVDESGKLVLSDDGISLNIENLMTDNIGYGFYRISTSDGKSLSADLWNAPSTNDGKYTGWRLERTSPDADTYTLASRNTEASAFMYLYQNSIYNRLATMPQRPGEQFAAAQWKLVSNSGEPEISVYDFREYDATYSQPQTSANTQEANLYRMFAADKWNIFCSPVTIDETQLKELFGNDVHVAEFTGVSQGELKFTTVYSIKAGVPYIIRITGEPQGMYTLVGNLEFAAEAGSVEYNGITFYGTLCYTPISGKAYGFDLETDAIVRLNQWSVGGMNGYFVPKYATSEITSWSLDGISTGINAVNSDAPEADVYNVGGQKVGTTKSTDGLQRGIYIVKGKKTSKN